MEHPSKWSSSIAKNDKYVCGACKKTIKSGTEFCWYRERARSSHEAAHGGLYPVRYRCLSYRDNTVKFFENIK